ncbi:MAG: cellobiose phosphorylase [Candidatus Omnitrophota bacterium]
MAKATASKKASYHLNDNGGFVIENYNYSKPMANFFPGIAGKYGIPMWVFYVNRGQGINSFGTDGKDAAILEFQPANKAWQQTSLLGFRTFMKVSSGKKEQFYEPFHNGFVNQGFDLSNRMEMSSYDLKIEEENKTLGLKTNVEYFTIPQSNFAGLVRIVTITNTSRKKLTVRLLDGLPRIVCFGIANLFLKKLSRTIEAWMRVENLKALVPFYKVTVDPIDRAQVVHIEGGNFFMGFHYEAGRAKLIKPIVDPETIFGPINDFTCPREFLLHSKFVYPKKQQTVCKTPCGFAHIEFSLEPGKEKRFYEVVGNARSVSVLNDAVKKILSPGFLDKKEQLNRSIIEALQDSVRTKSSSWEFDYYCRQTYLDNVMRGGYPTVFKYGGRQMVFYLYSRKHGDLERDYNKFQIQPTYFSQGNGNYRDMNQNRRCDVWFNPDIKDFNVITFMNLLQADGFNPLVVKGATFTLKDVDGFKSAAAGKISSGNMEKIMGVVTRKFTPGELILFIEENNIPLSMSGDEFLDLLMPLAVKNPEADFGEGYWIDHWHYNIDLIENYLAVYPENLRDILFDKRVLVFWDSDAVMAPRAAKYIMLYGKPKQLHSVYHDQEKKKMIGHRKEQPHSMRADFGKGDIYKTTVINKLVCLFVNKMASLDPSGVGIEMEADKPNWFDALNGLPALFGSSTCETFELKRLCRFIKSALLAVKPGNVALSEEIHGFLTGLAGLLRDDAQSCAQDRDFQYWDKSYNLKEEYRNKIKYGMSGRETDIPSGELISILDAGIAKIDRGLSKARSKDIYSGYFMNEVTEYVMEGASVKPTRFSQKPVVPFLEAQMHALRLTDCSKDAKAMYDGTKKSDLFDRKLKMYKVTAPLAPMPEEIGRCHAFTPGWLENESIWLHMEYKYILEVLEHGLYKEFYSDFKNVLIPFQKPQRYGRSILENSSFLVSSAFPYPDMHGNGFVARLSGSTVEFLQIWLVMNLGKQPFFLNDKGELNLKLSPALAGWLFGAKDKTYSFAFLSDISVVYHNPRRKDTFGPKGVSVKKIWFKDMLGKQVVLDSDVIPAPYADQIRSRQIKAIDIYLE